MRKPTDGKPKTAAERQATYVKRKQEERGQCTTCKNLRDPGFTTCSDCRAKTRARYTKPKIGISEARLILSWILESGIDDQAQAIKYAFNKFFNDKA